MRFFFQSACILALSFGPACISNLREEQFLLSTCLPYAADARSIAVVLNSIFSLAVHAVACMQLDLPTHGQCRNGYPSFWPFPAIPNGVTPSNDIAAPLLRSEQGEAVGDSDIRHISLTVITIGHSSTVSYTSLTHSAGKHGQFRDDAREN